MKASIEAARIEGLRGAPLDVSGGLVVPNGSGMGRLRHLRRDRIVDKLLGLPPRRRIEGRFNYGGVVINHFGHFMVDSVHRIVPSLRVHPERPFLYVGSRHVPVPPYARDIWELLGLGLPTIVHDDARVDEIFVHQQGSNYLGTTHGAYLDMLDDFERLRPERLPPVPEGQRIYVSRSALNDRPTLLGERYLDRILAAQGFTIFRPEQHPIACQIATYRAARMVVFGEGSAVHALELLGRHALRNVFLYNRRALLTDQMQAIQRLLKTRSEQLHIFGGNIYVGTLTLMRNGRDFTALGTTVLNITDLLESLREAGFLADASFSAADAVECIREDFQRYMAGGVRGPAPELAPPDLEATLHLAYAAAMTAIYGAAAARGVGA